MTPGVLAESLIKELGIAEPADLDVVAIAADAGVEVQFEDLSGCEATLAGFKNKAIATVRPSSARGRARFSIGHELGHWRMHRGQSFRCRADDVSDNLASDKTREKEADTYASHLLLPSDLFNPRIKALGRPGFGALELLGQEFETSLSATSIRLARIDTLPIVVACYRGHNLRWHLTAPHVPRRWWLRDVMDDDTFAFDLVDRGKLRTLPGKQPAEAWFTNDDADEFEVLEDCVPHRNGEILVLLYLTDAEMMERGFDANAGERRYGEHGSYVVRKKRN